MEHQPFSVAISVYKNDNPVHFDRALESITEQQTVKPNEIVLVVDGPVPDETNVVIDKYSKKYNLKVIRLETNTGLGNALRIATDNCSNEFVARMDSDDVSLPNRFESELGLFSSDSSLDIVGGNIDEFINEENNVVAVRRVPQSDCEIKQFLKKRSPLNHVSVIFKKESVIKSGNYIDLFWNEDYYLWIRMAEHGCKMANIAESVVKVRIGQDMYRRRGGYKYFKSEYFLQKYMLNHKMISKWLFISNVFKRFIVQVLVPSRLRGFLFRKFARK